MRTIAPYVILGLVVATVVWAVSFGTLPPADFTFSNLGEIKTVDPALVTGQSEGRIVWALFEGLTNWDPKTLQPRPGVAESWEISDDKLTYTFHLRGDALWSNGEPVTADDFVWSFRRFLHPKTAAEYSFLLWYVVGAEKFNTGKVEVGDPVEIELEGPPPSGRPFAAGPVVRGKLVAVEGADDAPEGSGEPSESAKTSDGGPPVYVVEIDGRRRKFQKGATLPDTTDYRWLVYDFRAVGIEAPDPHTVRFHLRHPVPYFLQLTGFYPLSPTNPRCIETYGYPGWTKPERLVTNGPFLLEFRRIRDRIRLVKNPRYWDAGNVGLESVDALAVESYPTNLNLYLTGQVDWIPTVPAEVVPQLLERKQGDFQPQPFLANYHYLVNTRHRPLGDVRVRRALALAINKGEIVESITRAGQQPARSIVPSIISQWADYTPQLCGAYDPDEARRLLAEAGFPGGRGFPRIEIFYNTSESHQAIAELIQHQWSETLGIYVGLRNQEWSAYLASRRQGDYDVARAGWIADYSDPITFLDMFTSDNPLNQTGWKNPEYDRQIAAALREPDDAKRLAHLEAAERILMDELPVIPLYHYVSQNMVRPYVKGFHANMQDVHPLRAIRIDRDLKRRVFAEEGLR